MCTVLLFCWPTLVKITMFWSCLSIPAGYLPCCRIHQMINGQVSWDGSDQLKIDTETVCKSDWKTKSINYRKMSVLVWWITLMTRPNLPWSHFHLVSSSCLDNWQKSHRFARRLYAWKILTEHVRGNNCKMLRTIITNKGRSQMTGAQMVHAETHSICPGWLASFLD